MKLIQTVIRSSLSRQIQCSCPTRAFSAMPLSDYRQNPNASDSVDDFEQQNFSNGNVSLSSIYKKLEKSDNTRNRPGIGYPFNVGNNSSVMDGLNESFDTSLTDGMDLKLKKAATYFEFDPEEVINDDYTFRPDVNFQSGMTYDTKDLDLQKPAVRKPFRRPEFETTTQEVLRKADFRNVRFLANFLTEAGIIIKRSKTGISAKAQRKVAREIKTARAFGLMPFTTMGTKHFVFGETMKEHELDFGYEAYEHNFVDEEGD